MTTELIRLALLVFGLALYITLLCFWVYVSVLCHELGHYICARLVGFDVETVNVKGTGPRPLFSMNGRWLLGIPIDLTVTTLNLTDDFLAQTDGTVIVSTAPQVSWSKLDALKYRLLVFILGGALAHLALLTLLSVLFLYSGWRAFLGPMLIEATFAFYNLISADSDYGGIEVGSDGRQALRVLRTDYRRLYQELAHVHQREVARYSQPKQVNRPLFGNDLSKLQIFMEAKGAIFDRQAFDEGIKRLKQLLRSRPLTRAEAASILDTLSAIVVEFEKLEYLPQADQWSQQAMKIAGYSRTIQGTRGAILFWLGRYDEALRLLLPLTAANNSKIDIVMASSYVTRIKVQQSGTREGEVREA